MKFVLNHTAYLARLAAVRNAFLVAASLASFATAAQATENGTSFYLQGLRDPFAALTPPPGVFFQATYYHYQADSGSKNGRLENGGLVTLNVNSSADIALLIPSWVPDVKIFGANPVLALIVPVGRPDVSADVQVTIPGAPAPGIVRKQNADTVLGDPVLSASLGWKKGNWNWNAGTLVNLPVGDYELGRLSNLAIHRPAFDFNGAVTYLDPVLGLETSLGAGFTLNGKNDDTHYSSGDEIHFDGSVSKFLAKNFSISALAYHTQQISRDGGSGNLVGGFQGQVTAVGGGATGSFKLGKIPVQAQLKVLQEVEVRKRLQGTVAFVSLSIPLFVNHPPNGDVPGARPRAGK